MSMCRVFSCVVGRGCLLWPVHSLGKTLVSFALLHSVFQGQIACYSRYFLTSYFCIPVLYNEKDIFFGVLVLEVLVGSHWTVQLQKLCTLFLLLLHQLHLISSCIRSWSLGTLLYNMHLELSLMVSMVTLVSKKVPWTNRWLKKALLRMMMIMITINIWY